MAQLEELGRRPIRDEAPAGADPRESPHYEAMQAEVARLGSLAGAGAVDWHKVAHNAAAVLESQAKDIPSAAYLGIALAEIQGVAGLAAGARVLADVLELWWESCFPPLKRLRARSNTVRWWRERAKAFLERPHNAISRAEHARLTEALAALDAAVSRRLPEAPPLYDILEAARRVPVLPAAPAAPPEDAAPADAAMKPASAQARPVAAPAAPAMPETGPEAAEEARVRLLAAARDLADAACAEAPPTDPAAWRAFYLSLWGRLRQCPPAEAGQTALPPPDGAALGSCLAFLSAGNATGAVTAFLRLLPSCPFCLTAQRHLDAALTQCGAEYALPLLILRQEAALFLRRLPGVEALRFSDGAPFADEPCLLWLRHLQAAGQTLPGGPEASAEAAPAAGTGEHLYARALRDADECISGQQYGKALELLHLPTLGLAHAGARRLPLQLRQLEALCRLGKWELAVSLAESIAATLDRHRLDTWQPELCFKALAAVLAAWKGLGDERAAEKIRRIMPRLAALDLPACGKLEG